MKCISDAATTQILRLSNREAAFLVTSKPLRYAYVTKAAYKQEQAYLAGVSVKAKAEIGKDIARKSRRGRRSDGEFR